MTEDERQKRRQAFIDRHKHDCAGMILDGSVNRTGGEMAFWARGIMRRVDQQLAHMFDELVPPEQKPIAPLTEADKAKLAAQRGNNGR